MEGLRKQLVEAAKEVYQRKLVVAEVGNVSVREKNRFLVSATGASLGHLTEADIVAVDFAGKKVEGEKEPAAEMWMHLEIYKKRDDVAAVVHAHPPYASALGYLRKRLKPVNPESEYVLGEVPLVPPFVAGTKELAEAVVKHLGNKKAALLEVHGIVAVGENLREAVSVAELVEEAAKINYLVEALGEKRD